MSLYIHQFYLNDLRQEKKIERTVGYIL
jgi:hypothetical protein